MDDQDCAKGETPLFLNILHLCCSFVLCFMNQLRTKYYFVSDVHLRPTAADAHIPQERFLSFLESAGKDAAAIYLLGDIFDYWYEYKYTIPRGYTRVLGKLAELSDSGVKLYFMRGNHDVWMYDYLSSEIGGQILEQPYF